jgi:hypothetical protein
MKQIKKYVTGDTVPEGARKALIKFLRNKFDKSIKSGKPVTLTWEMTGIILNVLSNRG